jgi:hypothetical protein
LTVPAVAAANSNIHLHSLVPDGVYRCGADDMPACVDPDAPTDDELDALPLHEPGPASRRLTEATSGRSGSPARVSRVDGHVMRRPGTLSDAEDQGVHLAAVEVDFKRRHEKHRHGGKALDLSRLEC